MEAARRLAAVAGAAWLVTGVVLFVAPRWASEHFAWSVSPFVAMTIGGWCLGTAAFAFAAAWRGITWRDDRVVVVYLWAFGVLELGVALAYRDKLALEHPLSWAYLVALVATVTSGVAGVLHLRASERDAGPRDVPPSVFWVEVVFVVFVGLLAAVALAGRRIGLNGRVFPEPMSLFTLRGFGAFYASLSLAFVAVLNRRSMTAVVRALWCGIALIVPITAASFVYIGRFDFSDRPLGALYIGAYLVALVGAVVVIARHGSRRAPLARG